MIFDLENLNPGTFFPFDKKEPQNGGLELRVCNGQAMLEIDKETTKLKYEYADGKLVGPFRQVIPEKANLRDEMIWDYSIVALPGLTDKGGNPIEPTIENKAQLMRGATFLMQFYNASMTKLNQALLDHQRALEKN